MSQKIQTTTTLISECFEGSIESAREALEQAMASLNQLNEMDTKKVHIDIRVEIESYDIQQCTCGCGCQHQTYGFICPECQHGDHPD